MADNVTALPLVTDEHHVALEEKLHHLIDGHGCKASELFMQTILNEALQTAYDRAPILPGDKKHVRVDQAKVLMDHEATFVKHHEEHHAYLQAKERG